MIVWKPPAVLILGLNFGFALLLGFLVVNVLALAQPGDTAGGIMISMMGLGTAVSDIAWRRTQQVSLGDLEASTVFFVIPTWVVGAVIFLSGLSYFTRG